MKYMVVFVDLGGVLVLNRAREIGEYFENKYSLDQIKTRDIFKFIQSGKKNDKDVDSLLLSVNVAKDVWKEYLDKFIETEVRNDNLFNILDKARKKDIKIVYTSNNSSNIEKIIKKYSLDRLPDLVINSSDAGVSKPDLAFWEVSFAETSSHWPKIKKSEVLVIDDSAVNCDSATSYGFDTVLYKQDVDSKIEKMLEFGR